MSSTARDQFLANHRAFADAVDESIVLASDAKGDFLRRGLAVAAFSLLETFIEDRLAELVSHINGGATQFINLPQRVQKQAIVNTVEVFRGRIRRLSSDMTLLRAMSRSVGSSLTAVGRSMALSPYVWLWNGSNMRPNDFHDALRLFHVQDPWRNCLTLTGRLQFPVVQASGPIDLRQELALLLQERNRCAHEAGYGVTPIWIRALPNLILRYAIAFDSFASVAADAIRKGNTAYLADENYLASTRVSLRFVKERRSGDYAEIMEGRVRAARVHKDPEDVFRVALGKCGGSEVLVQLTAAGQVVKWAIPVVG